MPNLYYTKLDGVDKGQNALHFQQSVHHNIILYVLFTVPQCHGPYYVGNGVTCTIDRDGDGYPNTPLSECDETTADLRYCTQVRELCR